MHYHDSNVPGLLIYIQTIEALLSIMKDKKINCIVHGRWKNSVDNN